MEFVETPLDALKETNTIDDLIELIEEYGFEVTNYFIEEMKLDLILHMFVYVNPDILIDEDFFKTLRSGINNSDYAEIVFYRETIKAI